MKTFYKNLLFGMLLLVVPTTVWSQSFGGGLLVGPTISQVDGNGYRGYHQLGWTAGAFANLPIQENLLLQMELKYALFGSHSDIKEEDLGMSHYNLRLHYAEVPLMLRYNLKRFTIAGKSLDFISLEAGVSMDFLLKYLDESAYSHNDNAPWRFFSATANAGIHFNITDRFGFDFRTMNSFIPIRMKGNTSGFFVGHYYNIALQAVLTYNIGASHRY